MKIYKKETKGITLIALIITIIVLLILAGVSLNGAINEGGIFERVLKAKEVTEKASTMEKIDIILAEYIIEKNVSNASEDFFWDELENQKIINDKDKDVDGPEIDDEGNKIYQVETTDGYTVEVTIDPDGNITIGDITKSGEAKVRKIIIKASQTSMHIEVLVKNMEKSDKLIISYKHEDETQYTQINEKNSTTADKDGLVFGNFYDVQAKIVDKDGNVKSEKKQKVQLGIPVKEIILNKTNETLNVGDKLQLVANIKPQDATNKEVNWISNNTSVAPVDENGLITATVPGEATITAIAKDGTGIKAECIVTVIQPATGITLNETTGTVNVGKTLQLIATVTPENASDKSINWTVSSGEAYVTVDQNGIVTGIAEGNAVVTVTTKDGKHMASCNIKVEPRLPNTIPTPEGNTESDWDLLSKVSTAIENDNEITSNDESVKVKVDSEEYIIKIGDIHKLKYNGEIREVRIVGFKHDELADGSGKKAGITFEFISYLMGPNKGREMNQSNTNTGGWGKSEMRTFLNGSDGVEKLSNKNYIKQVKKEYIKDYDNASSKNWSNDKLWLFSCGEIWSDGRSGGVSRGNAIATEGSQYAWYKKHDTGYSNPNDYLKREGSSYKNDYWTRSPYATQGHLWCTVYSTGACERQRADDSNTLVVPGFCI